MPFRSDLTCICSSQSFVTSATSCVLTNCPDEAQVAQQLLTTECRSGEFFHSSIFIFFCFSSFCVFFYSCPGSFPHEAPYSLVFLLAMVAIPQIHAVLLPITRRDATW